MFISFSPIGTKYRHEFLMRLRASRITKTFGHRTIVKDVDIAIDAGEVVTIFGPNGAGKTTLIKILATLLQPTSGKLEIEGMDALADAISIRRCLGVIIHESLAYPEFSPHQNLKFFGRMYGVKPLEERCTMLLDEVGLSHFAYEPLRVFSRGMTQRFMIARALLHHPSVLLFDEPFSGLDATAKQFMLQRIEQEKRNGRAILITTHNIDLGYLAGTRFLFMINGKLEGIASKEQIKADVLVKRYESRLIERNE